MSEITYKPLAKEFKRNGFVFRELRRDGNIAIFHKVGIGGGVMAKTHDAGFEVVVIGRHNGYTLGDVPIEPAETMPSSEQWGDKGFTYPKLLDAEIKFAQLLNKATPYVVESPDSEVVSDSSVTSDEPRRGRPRVAHPMLSIPSGEFSVQELADHNKVAYVNAYLFVNKEHPELVKLVRMEQRAARGRKTSIYTKNDTKN